MCSSDLVDQARIDAEHARIARPLSHASGLPPGQVEYKLRRMVNDYLQPPKATRKMLLALERFEEISNDIQNISAENPHELMRAMEVQVIHDCARMAAHASLFREESRWGLYHNRVDFPKRNDAEWFTHCHLKKDGEDGMRSFKKPVEPYLFPLDDEEKTAYQRLRVVAQGPAA